MYRKNLAKLEAKKRAQLGDEAFLRKYIAAYSKSDKIMKILLPILLVCGIINLVLSIVMFPDDEFYNLSMLICWIIFCVFWGFIATLYYAHHFKFHAQKVQEWTEELKTYTQAQPLQSNNITEQ